MRVVAAFFSVALAVGSLTVTRASQGCDFRVNPTRVELDLAARTGAISIETQPGCAWTVETDVTWIHLGTTAGNGPGTIGFGTAAATSLDFTPRQGRLRIRWNTPTAGQDVLVTQNPPNGCSAAFTPRGGPTSSQTFGGRGGSSHFDVLADLFMSSPWRVTAASDWITFTNPPLGVLGRGDGAAFFTVAPNPSTEARDGTVSFCNGSTIGVHQAGRSLRSGPAAAMDFDDDGRSDPAIFRPSTGTWWVLRSQSGYTSGFTAEFGTSSVFPMPGDYDGDNRFDLAVYNPNGLFGAAPAGNWTAAYSSNFYSGATKTTYAFPVSSHGYTPQDVPLIADFNGDGKSDFVTYRGATGEWAVQLTDLGMPSRLPQEFPGGETNGHWQWGLPGDIPVPADYDGDGLSELAVWRPSNGVWFLRLSSLAYHKNAPAIFQWGLPGDIPIVGDFDGDRRTDLCVWRPSDGAWYIVYASTGYSHAVMRRIQWGLGGDIPVSGDYDGDGRTDLAVWRPSNATWYILLSSQGYAYASAAYFQWGEPGDVPLSARITGAQ